MTDGYVPGKLVQLTVQVEISSIGSAVSVQRKAIGARLVNVSARARQKRLYFLAAVKEELQCRDTRAADGPVTGRITRMRRGTFGKRLRHQIRSVSGVND